MEGISPNAILITLIAVVLVGLKKTPAWLRVLCVLVSVFLTWFETSRFLIRQHHGEMNVGVGWPYHHLTEYLRRLAEQGKHDELKSALVAINEHSPGISGVWLGGDKHKFSRFVDKLSKTTKPANRTTKTVVISEEHMPDEDRRAMYNLLIDTIRIVDPMPVPVVPEGAGDPVCIIRTQRPDKVTSISYFERDEEPHFALVEVQPTFGPALPPHVTRDPKLLRWLAEYVGRGHRSLPPDAPETNRRAGEGAPQGPSTTQSLVAAPTAL